MFYTGLIRLSSSFKVPSVQQGLSAFIQNLIRLLKQKFAFCVTHSIELFGAVMVVA